MFVIGITGGIGSGKTTAAKICKDYGIEVIDADEISKSLTVADGKAMAEIAQAFGKKIIATDGSLNRKAMSDMVFKNKKSLDILSSIVHKYVIAEIYEKVENYKQKKFKVIVIDAPIPVKNGFLDVCDQVWLVWTDDDKRIERLALRGMAADEAKRRILSQMTREEYEAVADKVITNNGNVSELEETVKAALNQELGLRGIKIAK
jgi:dephospho-CoA kinase